MTLRKDVFSAGRWTTTSLLARALLQIAQTMLLARLLVPADFGLMATVGAVYAVVSLFVDMGLSNALVHFPRPSPTVLSTLYWLNLMAAGLMTLVYAALAWPLSLLYHQPALLPAMLAMGLAMPLGALGQQFRVMAEKELDFSRLAIIEVVAAASGFAVALTVAMLGGGVYALVAAILVASATGSALAWAFLSAGLRPDLRFDFREVKPYLRYGSYRLGDSLLNNLHSQADVLIGSSIAGSAAMGLYTVPRDLTLKLANTVVNPIVTRVGLPVMARVQADKATLKSIYLRTLRMTSSVNFPIYAAIAVWADELVALLLGSQWLNAGDYMRVFATWGMIRSVGNPVGSLLYATGHVRRAFWWNMALLFLTPCLLLPGASWGGTRGLAIAMLCTQALLFYPLFRFLVKPACGASLREYASALAPPLLASLVAMAAGFSVSQAVGGDIWVRAMTGSACFAAAYLATSWMVNRQWLEDLFELLAPMLRLEN